MSYSVQTIYGYETRKAEGGKSSKEVTNVPPNGGARPLMVFGEVLTRKVPSSMTGGAYALFEVATPPGAGPPPHVQHREDESFYVLEGEYEFLRSGITVRAREDSLLYVPKGTLHAHTHVGAGVGRMLVIQTPGGLYEHFVEQTGQAVGGEEGSPASEDRLYMSRIMELAIEHGIEIPSFTAPCRRA